MKKLLLLLLLFIPFIVSAKDNITIEKIEYVDKSDTSEIKEEATFDDNKLNLNVKFILLNDFIKYKITLKNNTDKDYDINSEQDLTEYVKVGFEPLSEEDNILKANSTKEVYFTITYYKEVPLEIFKQNSTVSKEDIKSIEFTVKEDKIIVESKNPNTSTFLTAAIIILLVSGIVTALLIAKKRSLKAMIIISVLGIISIPLTIYALDKITINVESKIVIKHPSFIIDLPYTYENSPKEYLFDYGMTWQDFLESDYNVDNWTQTEYITVGKTLIQGSDEIEYRYIEIGDNKTGISVDEIGWGCGGTFNGRTTSYTNYYPIKSEHGIETIDSKIINDYTYDYNPGVSC